MANSYIPRWQNISVDFNDANSMMKNAMTSISDAGTVFDKMRQGILDEEQRAIENARAAEAAALAQAELNERIRANQADEANAAAVLQEQIRHAKEMETVAAGGLKLQQDADARSRADREAGAKAADILYEMQHGAQGVNSALAALKAAETMTPEMFEEAKLSGGMINSDTKQAYANIDEYRKALDAKYKTLNADFATKYPKLGNAGFEDLSSATGLERQFGRIYRQLGGTGLGTEYLPNYITRGVSLESKAAEADMAAKIEAAKNARLSEIEYGSWDKIVGTLTKSGIGAADAQAIGSTILGVQRALKSKGINISNKDVFNRIAETVNLPNDKKGVIGKGWDWLWGGDRASLGKYGMNSAVNDLIKLFTESKPGGSKGTPDTVSDTSKLPTDVKSLLSETEQQEIESNVTDWINRQRALFNKDVTDKEVADYRASVIKKTVDKAGHNTPMPNLATAVIRNSFSDKELKAAGIKEGKNFTGMTQLQFNTLMNNRGIKDPSIFLIQGLNVMQP